MLKRYGLAWLLLVGCLLALVASMGWISYNLLELDRQEEQAHLTDVLQSNRRMALWRLDARVTSILAEENLNQDWQLRDRERVASSPFVIAYFSMNGNQFVFRGKNPLRLPSALFANPQSRQQTGTLLHNEARDQDHYDWLTRRNLLLNVYAGWHQNRLFVFRKLGDQRVQGLELDWEALTLSFQRDIQNLLAKPRLRPIDGNDSFKPNQEMANLPLRLAASKPAFYFGRRVSPIQLMLIIAWSCMLLPVAGMAFLLFSAFNLNARRYAFVSAVTHELRTPLTTFRMYTEMLDEKLVPEDKQEEYIHTLKREADRLNHLVENVLNYARIERGRAQEDLQDCRLQDIFTNIEADIRERVESVKADFHENVAEDLIVKADPAALERIIVNLIDNACKYGLSDQARRIDLTASEADGEMILEVRDYGPGVSRKMQHRLFKPFSKSDRDAAATASGIGLGLALCRRLAQRMGGNLTFQNAAEGGAIFRLKLPLADKNK